MNLINIGKNELLKINENDIYFITIPGRMGDEDSVTIITKDFNCYRVSGLMYPSMDKNDQVRFKDLETAFPKWKEAFTNEGDFSKYKVIYMGFGNKLCVDKNIYDEFIVYLNNTIKNNEHHDEFLLDNGEYNPAIYYSSWSSAFDNMVNDKIKK